MARTFAFLLSLLLLDALFASAARGADPVRVAVLDALPPATAQAPTAETLRALSGPAWRVTRLSADGLADPAAFSKSSCDLLVLPHADTFPAAAQGNVLTFLRAGGRLLCVGGPPFSRYVYRASGGWRTREETLAALPPAGALIDLAHADAKQWQRGSSTPNRPASIAVEPSPHGLAIHMTFPQFEGWDHYAPPLYDRSPYPAGATLTAFWARGDKQTDALVVEWRERDGSRWITSVPLTGEWKRYTLAASDFRYWQDSASRGRGGAGDHFRPENAERLALGLAQSHAAMRPGPKQLWIAGIDALRLPDGMVDAEPPVLEGLSPWYKVNGDGPGGRVRPGGVWRPVLRYVGGTAIPAPGRLEIVAGTPKAPTAWLYLPRTGPYAGAAWGACPSAKDVERLAAALARSCVLVAGGSSPSYRRDEPLRFWASVASRSAAPQSLTVQARWARVGLGERPQESTEGEGKAATTLAPGEEKTVDVRGEQRMAPGDYAYTLETMDSAGRSLGAIAGRFTIVYTTRKPGPFVEVKDGEFAVAGKPWRPVGVNFWPRWVSGQDRDEYWASWESPNQYDAAAVETDLALAHAMGVTVVSIQYGRTEEAPALVDFLARCRNHGIRANVFLAGGNPLGWDAAKLQELIRAADLALSDVVFAYDVAWEPRVGGHQERKRLDAQWVVWVNTQYGSLDKAEKDWAFAAPREDGKVTNPADAQFIQDGPWRQMVNAYRRFIDDRIGAGYRQVREAIHEVDPRHLIGARSGYGGNGSLNVEGVLAFDLCAGARYLDFVSPEGYSLSGDWPSVRAGGGFTTSYARWAGNGKPVFWAEFGQSIYPQTTETKVDTQGAYHELIYRMVVDSGANGSACWWWPGGLRIDENSDFGIMNPDGSARPAALKLRDYAAQIEQMRLPPGGKPFTITFDRDADSRGYAGVWLRERNQWGQARERGEVPVLRTEGTGTTTANVPLVAVGNVPADGHNPLKYVNADLWLARQAGQNGWRVQAANTGEARWLCRGPGRVTLIIRRGAEVLKQVDLTRDVDRYGDTEWSASQLGLAAGSPASARLAIVDRDNRTWEFGARLLLDEQALRPG